MALAEGAAKVFGQCKCLSSEKGLPNPVKVYRSQEATEFQLWSYFSSSAEVFVFAFDWTFCVLIFINTEGLLLPIMPWNVLAGA